MIELNVNYSLKRIFSTSNKDYYEAIEIYLDHIHPKGLTETNEIGYWLDNYNTLFNDKFYLFCLKQNKNVIGFAEIVFFKEEKLLVVDYLAIKYGFRKNNTYAIFVGLLKDYFAKTNIYYNFVIAEIGHYNDNMKPNEKECALIRLFKIENFGVIRERYQQPKLSLNNVESEIQCTLMLYPHDIYKSLKKDTYLRIIKALYYKHYLRWFCIDPENYERYKIYIDELYENVKIALKNKKIIKINGSASIKSSQIETKKPESLHFALLLPFSFLIISAFSGILWLVKNILDVSDYLFICSLIIMSTLFLCIVAIYSEKFINLANNTINLISNFLSK